MTKAAKLTSQKVPSLPRMTCEMKAIRYKGSDAILEMVQAPKWSSVPLDSSTLRVSKMQLALYHVGNGKTPGFSQELRESVEKLVAEMILRPFHFEEDHGWRRFALLSGRLHRYISDPTENESSYPDHWVRGYFVENFQQYKNQVARALQGLTSRNFENEDRIYKPVPEDRRHHAGDWHPMLESWLRATGQRVPQGTNRFKVSFQRWARNAKNTEQYPWRLKFISPNVTRPQDYLPTSLRNPQPLMEGMQYLEVWELMDPASSFASPRLGYWIVLQERNFKEKHKDPIHLISAARSALAPKCPQYVHGRCSPTEPDEFVVQTISLGPFLDKREASNAAKRLKRKNLATGQVAKEPISRTLHRPASPDQWQPL